jgi:maltodextrin utilization protein YvdJ
MTSWITWIVVGLIIAVLIYAIFSIYLRKPAGLYMATAFHIVLGTLTFPSIGLYILGLAILELIAGVVMTAQYRRTRASESTK